MAPQGVVGCAVAAAVEAVADDTAGGRLDGTGAAQSGEGSVVAHPVGVVAGGDEQTSGGFGSHAVGAQ